MSILQALAAQAYAAANLYNGPLFEFSCIKDGATEKAFRFLMSDS